MTTDPRHLAYQRPPTLANDVDSIRNQLWEITNDIPMTVKQREVIEIVKDRLWKLYEKLNTLNKASGLDQTLGELSQVNRLQKQLAKCKEQRDFESLRHLKECYGIELKNETVIEIKKMWNKELEAIT